jgi:hypothetical protein
MEEKRPMLGGQVAREDPSAVSDLPAFLAPPTGAPAYYGFPLLPNSEKDGFVFGAITRPRTGASASWVDAYVVAPDGSRAGIMWVTKGPVREVVLPPEPGCWGVYQFRLEQPVESDAELIRPPAPLMHNQLRDAAANFPSRCRVQGATPIRGEETPPSARSPDGMRREVTASNF